MKPSEAAAVLTACASLDQRTIGDDEAKIWAQVFTKAGIALGDALNAVVNYHADVANVDKRATIQALIVQAKLIRRARMVEAGDPPFPPDLTVGQEMSWRRYWVEALSEDVTTAPAVADARMGIKRPNHPLVENPTVLGQLRAFAGAKAIA